jgi:hypothetical protein
MMQLIFLSAVETDYVISNSTLANNTVIAVVLRGRVQEKKQTCWLGIGIMCPSGETCLSADCCFSGLAL